MPAFFRRRAGGARNPSRERRYMQIRIFLIYIYFLYKRVSQIRRVFWPGPARPMIRCSRPVNSGTRFSPFLRGIALAQSPTRRLLTTRRLFACFHILRLLPFCIRSGSLEHSRFTPSAIRIREGTAAAEAMPRRRPRPQRGERRIDVAIDHFAKYGFAEPQIRKVIEDLLQVPVAPLPQKYFLASCHRVA